MDWTPFGIIFILIIGASVGSFLNVVIYRMPRGLSVHSPRWSFCPHCSGRIPPHFNVPVLGYLLLRGRCRQCRATISLIYPLIELLGALVFLMTTDAVYVSHLLPGTSMPVNGGAMLVAYLVLFAALLASAAMDIESYTIHIQLPLLAVAVGVVAHGVAGYDPATTQRSDSLSALPPALGAVSLAMGLTWSATRVLQHLREKAFCLEPTPADSMVDFPTPAESGPSTGINSPKPVGRTDGLFELTLVLSLALVVTSLAIWTMLRPEARLNILNISAGGQRALIACFVFMTALIAASFVHREADQQIVEDLDRERPHARPTAWRELKSFIPALFVGAIVLALLRIRGGVHTTWQEVAGWAEQSLPMGSHLIAGLAALAHAILAATVGWAVRILGTFAFGKEAFGSGDIFLMAAIGAVGGLWLVLIGFLLSAILALVGVVATSFRRSCRAIPFGPWLALGAFAGLWVQRPIVDIFSPAGWLFWELLSGSGR